VHRALNDVIEGAMMNRMTTFGLFVFATMMAIAVGHAQAPNTVLGVDCASIQQLGIDKQQNMRAGAIRVGCGLEPAGAPGPAQPAPEPKLAPPDNVDIITGTETYPHVTQSESMIWSSDGKTIVVNYNDSINAPSNYSGVSVSTNGGASFTRLLPSPFATGHGTNFGDPIVVFNAKLSKWFAGDLVSGPDCGAQGIGLWTSPDGVTWSAGACAHVGTLDDRESMWVDNNPVSPFYGRMYISWNDFNVGGGALFVTHSDDGVTWTPVQFTPGFIRDVQLTGGPDGTVFVAAMNEGGGGFNLRQNIMFRSTDGGATFSPITMGAPFAPPGDSLCSTNSYFAQMFPIWRHMGWGQPGVGPNGVVHYVFAGAGVHPGDHGDIYYTRSTDNGLTWSAPIVLNTDQAAGGTQEQWMPSLSVTASGEVFAYWYDRRNTTNGTNYEVWGRRSADNGVSFAPDEVVSTVLIPQPEQPDPNLVACYAGDYNYSTAFADRHYATWTDGRVQVSGHFQQDVEFAIKAKLSVSTHDFNGDGKSDIAWRESGGATAAWLMNGGQILQVGNFGVVSTNWQIVGQRDFNGDGMYDLLWRDANSGTVTIWLLNGLQVLQVGTPGAVANNWSIVGTGDFNGDGRGDILWRDSSTGTVAIWLMNGFQILQVVTPGVVGLNWHIVGTGDFNGDGNWDILWRDTSTGAVAIWLMNGGQILQVGNLGVVGPNWQIVGTGDFNGDGRSDILWRDSNTGSVAIWLIDGLQILQVGNLGTVGTNWVITETGDFDGDGKSDILWRDNSAGTVAVWFMNGLQISSVAVPGTVTLDWTIQGINAD
jgi:hypothetical protein